MVWFGNSDYSVEAVFDTGATRGSVDKEFLKALMLDASTAPSVLKLNKIDPIPCQGMDRNGIAYIDTVTVVRVSFREWGFRQVS